MIFAVSGNSGSVARGSLAVSGVNPAGQQTVGEMAIYNKRLRLWKKVTSLSGASLTKLP